MKGAIVLQPYRYECKNANQMLSQHIFGSAEAPSSHWLDQLQNASAGPDSPQCPPMSAALV